MSTMTANSIEYRGYTLTAVERSPGWRVHIYPGRGLLQCNVRFVPTSRHGVIYSITSSGPTQQRATIAGRVWGEKRTVLPMKIRNRWHCNSSFESRRGGWQIDSLR
jgi:hypothetical protein